MKIHTALTNRLGNRSSNQDRCLVEEKPQATLLAVADGMGGHARGDLAAQAAIDSLRQSFLGQCAPIADPCEFLKTALETAHLEVVGAGRKEQPRIAPRTTCVACLVQGDQAWWAHVGDSRLYLVRNGKIFTRTRDHTPIEDLLQSGAIDEDDQRSHPLRNSVSRCLGGAVKPPEISLGDAELKADDTLLLCSDGLWSALPEDKLAAIPRLGNLESAINQLTDDAETASYPSSDNISLVGLRWLSGARVAASCCASAPDAEEPRQQEAEKDPVQQAIDDIHRAMLDYAAELKK